MTWSPQQDRAIRDVKAWLKDPSQQVFRLFGYAGTGKTTLARELSRSVRGRTLFAAFTGKAALMMQRKGCVGASTIHSLIYSPPDGESSSQPRFVLNHASAVRDASLVVIDECSMVDDELARDLLYFDRKVLVLGDPAQLPPVKGAGYFTAGEPDVMLTEVHRQARDNPIIAMSMKIREGERLELGTYGDSRVVERADIDSDQVLEADQVLVGLNRTRRTYNDRIRALRGMPADPSPGDRLVCLRNNREKKLLNGGLWTVNNVLGDTTDRIKMLASSEDRVEAKPTEITVLRRFFDGDEKDIAWEERRGTDEFTYGYALTCHKSQGSQWNDVMVFDESSAFREDREKWLYTAITRAAERVTVVRR